MKSDNGETQTDSNVTHEALNGDRVRNGSKRNQRQLPKVNILGHLDVFRLTKTDRDLDSKLYADGGLGFRKRFLESYSNSLGPSSDR